MGLSEHSHDSDTCHCCGHSQTKAIHGTLELDNTKRYPVVLFDRDTIGDETKLADTVLI